VGGSTVVGAGSSMICSAPGSMTASSDIDLTSGPDPVAGCSAFPGAFVDDSVLNGAIEQAESESSAAISSQRVTRQA
jgi:hypothetical protein